jgi:glycine cleavage system H protein
MTTHYTKDHEWIRLDGDVATIGISEHAQNALGDIVFVELPEIGRKVEKGGEAAVVESVKAASDVYAEGKGWFFRLKLTDASQVNDLMTAEQYKEYLTTLE